MPCKVIHIPTGRQPYINVGGISGLVFAWVPVSDLTLHVPNWTYASPEESGGKLCKLMAPGYIPLVYNENTITCGAYALVPDDR